MRSVPGPTWARTAALAMLGAALAACNNDSPTAATPTPPAHASTIRILPDGGLAAARAVNLGYKILPIIPKRTSTTASASLRFDGRAAVAQVDNPTDLSPHTDTVISRAINFNIYVNCATTALACWGSNGLTPGMFLKDLNNSRIISVMDQYLFGKKAARSFGFDSISGSDQTIINAGNVATVDDLYNILFSVASLTGEYGLGTIYHIFLPQGTDTCTQPGVCYSPDSLQNWVFCAYHSAVDFGGGIVIVYSVEPYQAVNGCSNPANAPTDVIDPTASTLSHEFFESATDPHLNAWFSEQTGEEVADLCTAFEYVIPVGLHHYRIQSEYSNAIHNCTNDPFK
jgi:hypothetical protein